jgi:TonB family protein
MASPREGAADVKAPTVLERVAPELSICHGADLSGNPRLAVTVTERGTVEDVVVTLATFPCIDSAVVAAVRKWKFRPGTLNQWGQI